MKQMLFSIICVFFLSANLVSALSYTDPIPTNTSTPPLSSSQIAEAQLLEGYISRYKEKILSLYAKYSSEESIAIENANIQLGKMQNALRKIQTRSISEKDANDIMQHIVKDIKILNTRMKSYLEQEQIEQEQKLTLQKQKYAKAGSKISNLLNIFIEQLSSKLVQKETLSEKEKEIVRSLLRIREENKKIQNFSNLHFSSTEEMKSYLQNIIENIRKDISTIKELSS